MVVNGSTRLRVVDLASGDTTTLPPTVSNDGPAALTFSADSRWVFFVSGSDLYANEVGSQVSRTIEVGAPRPVFVAAL